MIENGDTHMTALRLRGWTPYLSSVTLVDAIESAEKQNRRSGPNEQNFSALPWHCHPHPPDPPPQSRGRRTQGRGRFRPRPAGPGDGDRPARQPFGPLGDRRRGDRAARPYPPLEHSGDAGTRMARPPQQPDRLPRILRPGRRRDLRGDRRGPRACLRLRCRRQSAARLAADDGEYRQLARGR